MLFTFFQLITLGIIIISQFLINKTEFWVEWYQLVYIKFFWNFKKLCEHVCIQLYN